MATENGTESISPDEDLARALYIDRAHSIRWLYAPIWAWKYKAEGVFGQTKAYWLSEDESRRQSTAPVFEVADGESVVIPLDWR